MTAGGEGQGERMQPVGEGRFGWGCDGRGQFAVPLRRDEPDAALLTCSILVIMIDDWDAASSMVSIRLFITSQKDFLLLHVAIKGINSPEQ